MDKPPFANPGRRRFLATLGMGMAGWNLESTSANATPVSPSDEDWARLNRQVLGRLLQPVSPWLACQEKPGSAACEKALRQLRNPFWLEAQPGATQSAGWAGAWSSQPSTHAIAAETAEDVAAGVRFAKRHGLRVVIKGTGHDYLGRSNDPEALLIWTHRMRGARFDPAFRPVDAPAERAPIKALHVRAGSRWIEAYTEATTRHGVYVQGGGCTTVGAAGGFTQGGGFGSFSKKFGTGAAGLVEAEVVTASGEIVIANDYRHPDLFWALRGGGGSTFGIVTRMSYLTHPLPECFGLLTGVLKAKSEPGHRQLLERFIAFYAEALNNENWGEQFTIKPDRSIELSLVFQGLQASEVKAIWNPLLQWVSENDDIEGSYQILEIPGRSKWDEAFWKKAKPDLIQINEDPGHFGTEFWWASNSSEVSKFWYTYRSRYIPFRLFQPEARLRFVETLMAASRLAPLGIHINKGLSGASQDAIDRTKETSMHPAVFDAAALMIVATGESGVHPDVPGRQPDLEKSRQANARIDAAMKLIRTITPNAGTYAAEADYFEPDWQTIFWGPHYPKLLSIKKKWDPDGFFRCHHSVGSELG